MASKDPVSEDDVSKAASNMVDNALEKHAPQKGEVNADSGKGQGNSGQKQQKQTNHKVLKSVNEEYEELLDLGKCLECEWGRNYHPCLLSDKANNEKCKEEMRKNGFRYEEPKQTCNGSDEKRPHGYQAGRYYALSETSHLDDDISQDSNKFHPVETLVKPTPSKEGVHGAKRAKSMTGVTAAKSSHSIRSTSVSRRASGKLNEKSSFHGPFANEQEHAHYHATKHNKVQIDDGDLNSHSKSNIHRSQSHSKNNLRRSRSRSKTSLRRSQSQSKTNIHSSRAQSKIQESPSKRKMQGSQTSLSEGGRGLSGRTDNNGLEYINKLHPDATSKAEQVARDNLVPLPGLIPKSQSQRDIRVQEPPKQPLPDFISAPTKQPICYIRPFPFIHQGVKQSKGEDERTDSSGATDNATDNCCIDKPETVGDINEGDAKDGEDVEAISTSKGAADSPSTEVARQDDAISTTSTIPKSPNQLEIRTPEIEVEESIESDPQDNNIANPGALGGTSEGFDVGCNWDKPYHPCNNTVNADDAEMCRQWIRNQGIKESDRILVRPVQLKRTETGATTTTPSEMADMQLTVQGAIEGAKDGFSNQKTIIIKGMNQRDEEGLRLCAPDKPFSEMTDEEVKQLVQELIFQTRQQK